MRQKIGNHFDTIFSNANIKMHCNIFALKSLERVARILNILISNISVFSSEFLKKIYFTHKT